MDLEKIINGYTNKTLDELNLLRKEKSNLADTRMSICQKCEIFDSKNFKCDSSKGGCGCNMKAKIYCTKCECPKRKW